MKLINKEYTVYDLADLKQDDELCERIYEEFWLNDANNSNPWADENINSFKKFADTLNMKLNYSLSNADYPDRGCYIKLTPDYYLDNKDYKELLKDYTGNGYYFCDELQAFTSKLLDKKEYKVLCEWSINSFVLEIQNKMFEMWFADNKDYFSKESFLNDVEVNEWQFDADGNLF